MPQLLIVADDLTGAADTGAGFAALGLSTVIPLAGAATPDADVVVLSTETRDLDGKDAARIVSAAVTHQLEAHPGAGPRWFYKKIDSALRGNPRAELSALMAASGQTRALVAPAFPAEGRTTVGGRQFVNGLPLAESPFGGEGATSDIAALFGATGAPAAVLILPSLRDQPAEIAAILESEATGILIADAATGDDLLTLARAASQTTLRVLCGTAGFARALAQTLQVGPNSSVFSPDAGGRPVLVVAGSQNEATRRQVARLAETGTPVVRPAQGIVDGVEPLDAVVREVETHLAAGRSTVLTTAGLADSPLGGRVVAERLAQIVTTPRIVRAIGGLVLTGGDVAASVLAALGVSYGIRVNAPARLAIAEKPPSPVSHGPGALWAAGLGGEGVLRLGGEIAPGQPWGVLEFGDGTRLPVATKAGSFGDEDALLAAVDYLTTAGTGPRQ